MISQTAGQSNAALEAGSEAVAVRVNKKYKAREKVLFLWLTEGFSFFL